MEVRDQRANVAQAVWLPVMVLFGGEITEVALETVGEALTVPHVDAKDRAAARRLDPGVRQNELSETRVKGEPVDLAPERIDEHGGGAVDDVPRRDLLGPRLKEIFQL